MLRHQGRRVYLIVLLAAIALSSCAELIQLPATTPSPRVQPTSATASPASSPTLPPLSADELFSYALQQRSIGAYESAAQAFFQFSKEHAEDIRASDAGFYLAENFFLRGQYTSAIAAFDQYISRAQTNDILLPRAYVLVGRSAAAHAEHERAVSAFQHYQSFDTLLSPYARLLEASSLVALQRYEQAGQAYAEAASQELVRTEQALAFEQAANITRDLGRPSEAAQLYNKVLERSELPAYRAKIMLESARVAAQNADSQQQQALLIQIIRQYPETAQGLSALEQAVQDTVPITASLAATTYALHERWNDAIPYYDQAIQQTSGAEQLELRRQRALALRSKTPPDYATALTELAAISTATPTSKTGLQAQLDWIQTLGQSGNPNAAITAYREYATSHPDDQRAPEALQRAAILLERQSSLREAAIQRLELARRYPQSNLSPNALMLAGIRFVRLAEPDQARQAFELLSKARDQYQAARGNYWLGRLSLDAGNTQAAEDFLELCIQQAPDSYEAARATELLDRVPQGQYTPGSRISQTDWQEFDQWLSSWAQPITTTIDIANDAGAIRAIMLEEVWMHAEAKAEWNGLLDTWQQQPQALAQIARLAYERDLTYVALLAALRLEALLEQASQTATNTTHELPKAMQLLLHPMPYLELVQQEAARYELDARLLYALFRQESAFDAQATSWVGARGLAQVMPETGAGLARGLGVSPFSDDDLYRPVISVRFGASYLAEQLKTLNGNIQGALSAYNGGLGNTYRWDEQSPLSDPDLFIEQIDFAETRSYVRRVYGFYGAYQRLYALK